MTPRLDRALTGVLVCYVTLILLVYTVLVIVAGQATGGMGLGSLWPELGGLAFILVTLRPLIRILSWGNNVCELRRVAQARLRLRAIKLADREFGWRPRSGVAHPQGALDRWDRWLPQMGVEGHQVAFLIEQWCCGSRAWYQVDIRIFRLVDPDNPIALGEAQQDRECEIERLSYQSVVAYKQAYVQDTLDSTQNAILGARQKQRVVNAHRMADLYRS